MLHKKSLDFSSIKYLLIFNKPGPYRKDWLMEMKMKILKTLILIPFFMFGKSVLADTTISLGAGVQQGGFMGVQLAQFSDDKKHKFRGALGVIGGTFGYDYMITRNISVGGSVYYYNILNSYQGTALPTSISIPLTKTGFGWALTS